MPIGIPDIEYVQAVPTEPQKVVEFWSRNQISLSPTDNPEEILRAASLYPSLFITAYRREAEDEIVGTVWGNFDGRRGYVVHLAVKEELRGQGLGRRLMQLMEEEFRRLGCYKVHLFVEEHNRGVGEFYRRIGFSRRDDLILYSKTLR